MTRERANILSSTGAHRLRGRGLLAAACLVCYVPLRSEAVGTARFCGTLPVPKGPPAVFAAPWESRSGYMSILLLADRSSDTRSWKEPLGNAIL